MPKNFYLNREFEEFEELAEDLRLWNIHIRKLENGKSTNSLKQLTLGGMQLASGFFSGKTYQVGDAPPGKTFAFHTERTSNLVWRRKNVPQNGLMIFPDKSELDIVTKGTCNNVYTVTMPENMLISRLEARSQDACHKLLSSQDFLLIPMHHLIKLKNLFHICYKVIENDPNLITSPTFEKNIQEEFLNTVSQALSPIESCSSHLVRASKPVTWKKIEEVMHLALDSPMKVNELSQATGVSERTLLRLFHERFGISPKAYLCRIRLNGVRHNLKRSLPGKVKISDIANAWGFWHMGQFAADYKKLFGELPSATLKTSL